MAELDTHAATSAGANSMEVNRNDGGAGLADPDFELVMLHVDGELRDDPLRAAAAVALLERDPVARAVAADWTEAKVALREALWNPAVDSALQPAHGVDLSRVRGRVMTRLPVEPRALPVDAAKPTGLGGWLRSLGVGKVMIAVGGAVAVAVWLVATANGPTAGLSGGTPAMAAAPASEPDVIIEEMEIEGGSIVVDPGKGPGAPTIIWHFDVQGAG